MIENDISQIRKIIVGKTIKDIEQKENGVVITFTDGTSFTMKALYYQMELK